MKIHRLAIVWLAGACATCTPSPTKDDEPSDPVANDTAGDSGSVVADSSDTADSATDTASTGPIDVSGHWTGGCSVTSGPPFILSWTWEMDLTQEDIMVTGTGTLLEEFPDDTGDSGVYHETFGSGALFEGRVDGDTLSMRVWGLFPSSGQSDCADTGLVPALFTFDDWSGPVSGDTWTSTILYVTTVYGCELTRD